MGWQDPFGANQPPGIPRLNRQDQIAAGAEVVDLNGLVPQNELEDIFAKQPLLIAAMTYPQVMAEVRYRVSAEFTQINLRLPAALAGFQAQVSNNAVQAQRAQSSLLAKNAQVLVDPPILGQQTYSSHAIKYLEVGLQGKRLSGISEDALDYTSVLIPLRNVITEYQFSNGAAYTLAKRAFGGYYRTYLESCENSRASFGQFWSGIQRTLSASRSPAALLSMISLLKSKRPTNIMETFNRLHMLHRLHSNISGESEVEAMKHTRASYIEILRSHYSTYHALIKQEDDLQMSMLENEMGPYLQAGLDPTPAFASYHPVVGFLQIVLYVLGNEVAVGMAHPPAPVPPGPAHPPPARPPMRAGGGEWHNRFPRQGNYPVHEVDADSAHAPNEVGHEPETVPDYDVTEEEAAFLRHWQRVEAESQEVEASPAEKRFKPFPTKLPARTRQPATRTQAGAGGDKCFGCGSQSHWLRDCPSRPTGRSPQGAPPPAPDVAAFTTEDGVLTVGQAADILSRQGFHH